jgi:hypothetical protein
VPQRLAAGVGADDALPQVLQHRLQCQEFLRAVVDDEYSRLAVGHRE